MKKKNILFISIDDGFAYWRYRTAFGARLHTPNLDRICKVSTAFQSAYCQVPICGPSRSSFMSGLSPYETGVFDNYTSVFDVMRPQQFWSYRLKQDGYYCSTAGKIHHGYKPLPDDIHNTLYSHPSSRVFFGPAKDADCVKFGGLNDGRGTLPDTDRQYYDFRSSQHAIRFLKGYDGDAPFYREAGFHNPHPPFRTPIRFKEMYNVDDFIHPDEWSLGFDLSEFTARYMIENIDVNRVDFWKKSVRNYFSGFSHVDFHIGRVWNTLKASKYADNTVVVITTDHGYHMGDKGRFRKFTLWEEAARVPLIVHDPDMPAQEIQDPVSLIDIGPTVLDYAECRPMQYAVGKSLRPLVEGETQEKRAVPTFWYGSASIRKGSYRTTLYQDGSAELYDLDNDMWLTKNLASDKSLFEPAKKDLLATCKQYGMQIVEPDATINEPALYFSVLKGAQAPATLGTNGVFSVGSAPVDSATPGYKKQWAIMDGNDILNVSKGVDELHFASDTNGGVTHFTAVGNDDGNKFVFKGSHNRFKAEIHAGAGDDVIETSHDSLIAYTGAGNDTVYAGVADGVVYGGIGTNTIHAIAGDNQIFGGPSNDTVYGGTGNDTIYSGSGFNQIESGAGNNTIVVNGGSNTIVVGEGENTIVFKRTALKQQIENYGQGSIDLTDWSCIGRATITQIGKDVSIDCNTESILFKNVNVETIKANITGIEVNS